MWRAKATGQATVTTYPLTFKPEWVCDVKAGAVEGPLKGSFEGYYKGSFEGSIGSRV